MPITRVKLPDITSARDSHNEFEAANKQFKSDIASLTFDSVEKAMKNLSAQQAKLYTQHREDLNLLNDGVNAQNDLNNNQGKDINTLHAENVALKGTIVKFIEFVASTNAAQAQEMCSHITYDTTDANHICNIVGVSGPTGTTHTI